MWTVIGFSALGGVVLAFAWVIYEGVRAPRWDDWNDRMVAEAERLFPPTTPPSFVPENIMSLPHVYRPFDQETD